MFCLICLAHEPVVISEGNYAVIVDEDYDYDYIPEFETKKQVKTKTGTLKQPTSVKKRPLVLAQECP